VELRYLCVHGYLFFVVTAKVCLETRYWTWVNVFLVVFSVVLVFGFQVVYQTVAIHLKQRQEYDEIFPIWENGNYWFEIILLIVICMAPNVIWKLIRRIYFPKSYQILQEIEKYKIPFKEPPKVVFKSKKIGFKRNIVIMKDAIVGKLSSPEETYHGYAFDQSEGQRDWMLQVLSKKSKLRRVGLRRLKEHAKQSKQ